MKVGRKLVVAFAFILAFLFLVPVVSYSFPPGLYSCPEGGCHFPRYGSATYWGLGVGGIWTYANGYSISIAPASTAVPSHTATSVTDAKNDLQLQLSLNASSSSATGVSISVPRR